MILRPHQIWSDEPNMFTRKLLDAYPQMRIIGDGKNRVDSIHVKDAATAHVKALIQLLKKPDSLSGKDFNLSSSRPFLLWEYINDLYLQHGLDPISDKISVFNARSLMKLKKLVSKSDSKNDFSDYLFIQLSVDRWFDCSRAWRDFAFECTRFQ